MHCSPRPWMVVQYARKYGALHMYPSAYVATRIRLMSWPAMAALLLLLLLAPSVAAPQPALSAQHRVLQQQQQVLPGSNAGPLQNQILFASPADVAQPVGRASPTVRLQEIVASPPPSDAPLAPDAGPPADVPGPSAEPPSPEPSPAAAPPPADPRVVALLNFKAAITNADQVPQLASWVLGTDPCTPWRGLQCDANGTIIALGLSGTTPPLTGTISASLVDPSLYTLTLIDLSNNALTGVLPNSFDNTGAMPNLVTLKLSNNQIKESLSFGSDGFGSLHEFDIDGNSLQVVPAWSFTKLQLLQMQNNLFGGAIPAYLQNAAPAGAAIVLTPQKGNHTICGALPAGPSWQSMNGQGQFVPLAQLPSCGAAPAPAPAPAPPPFPPPPPPFPSPPPPPPPSPAEVLSTPPPPPANHSSALGTTTIVAIAVGGGVGVALIATLLYLCCRPKRQAGKGGKGDDGVVLDDLEEGYYATNGQWKAGHRGDSASGGKQLAHQGSGSMGGSPSQKSFDPLLVWMTKAREEADAAAAAAAGGGTPSHSRQPSRSGPGQLPMDVQLWTLNFRDLHIEKQIGEGSFGRVYLAKWHETPVALKVLLGIGVCLEEDEDVDKALTMSSPVLDGLAKESSMMAALRHPNVVGFLGVCLSPPCIVTDYCARGSLTDVLRGGKSSRARAALLVWERRLSMALDAAKGMLYLHAHQPPIIHRDLKSPNLLVDKHWRCKVSDFNLSKLMEEGSVMSSMAATNPRWLAPEILTGNDATFASDVYAFGVVLWELLTWELPWGSTNPWQVVTVVTEGGRLEVPRREDLPGPDTASFEGLDGYVALMRRCWAHNVDDRPSFQEIIAELREMLAAQVARGGKGLGVSPVAHSVQVGEDTPPRSAGTVGALLSTTPPSPPLAPREVDIFGRSLRRSELDTVPAPAVVEWEAGGENAAAAAATLAAVDVSRGVQVRSPSIDSLAATGSGGSTPGSPDGDSYASINAQTGSLVNPADLNSGWFSSKPARRGG